MKINTLIVCHDRFMSGANRSLYDWLSSRDQSLISPIVLLPRRSPLFEEQLKKIGCEVWTGNYTVPVRHLEKTAPSEKVRDLVKYVYAKLVNPFQISRIARKAKERKISIVHSNSFATIFGAQLANKLEVPHVWHIREFGDLDHGFVHYKSFQVAKLCEKSNAIFISQVIKSHYERLFSFKSCCCITNRVAYDSRFNKTRNYIEDGLCNLLIVGYLSEAKGQLDAIEAVIKLHRSGYKVHLYLCGEGDWGQFSKDLSNEELSYISFLGYRSDVYAIRESIDIALVCSRMEAFGRVTIESLYYKNLVIGADSGCTPQIISNGINGYLYPTGDVDELVRVIERCISHRDGVDKQLNESSYAAIKLYSNDISASIFDYYLKCLDGKVFK